ncbi:MAG: DUF167 domain-containing protein [Spirochaetales bacterium]|nr:DUF167 domain-containing protein [Spirochaetales bacterium]
MRVSIKVIPAAGSNKINGCRNGELVFKVKAQAEKGKANKELLKYISKLCGIPRSEISIVSGSVSHHKIIEIPDEYKKNIEKLR